jgi:hypothetical protein
MILFKLQKMDQFKILYLSNMILSLLSKIINFPSLKRIKSLIGMKLDFTQLLIWTITHFEINALL